MLHGVLRRPLSWAAASLLVAGLAAACGDGAGAPPADKTPPAGQTPPAEDGTAAFSIQSIAFADGETIPVSHTCDGEGVSPPLDWTNAPEGAQSFALIMDDADAPGGTFTHWVIYNLPADPASLRQGIANSESPESGGTQGTNDFGGIGYGGPCPPEGPAHTYSFKLYALDGLLDLEPGAARDQLLAAVEGHVLAEALLTGDYGR